MIAEKENMIAQDRANKERAKKVRTEAYSQGQPAYTPAQTEAYQKRCQKRAAALEAQGQGARKKQSPQKVQPQQQNPAKGYLLRTGPDSDDDEDYEQEIQRIETVRLNCVRVDESVQSPGPNVGLNFSNVDHEKVHDSLTIRPRNSRSAGKGIEYNPSIHDCKKCPDDLPDLDETDDEGHDEEHHETPNHRIFVDPWI